MILTAGARKPKVCLHIPTNTYLSNYKRIFTFPVVFKWLGTNLFIWYLYVNIHTVTHLLIITVIFSNFVTHL